MTVSLKHLVTATGTDAGNGQIGKAQWNDEHTLTLASQKLLGRASSGSGPVEEIDLTAAGRALLDDADASEQRSTLGLGSIATQSANGVAITGGTITGITDLAISDGGTGASDPAGARSNLGLGSLATLSSVDTAQITNSAVTYAKIQNVSATDRILGRASAGSGVVEEIICTAAGRALLDDANATAQIATLGLSASSGSNSVGFLQAGTGAVARTAQSKMRDIVSVLDFGADPTGATDSTAALQAAINSGYSLVFPAGDYKANNLSGSTNFQRFYAQGRVTITKNANGPLFSHSGIFIELNGIQFNGDATTPVFTGDNIVLTGTNPRLINCGSQWAYGRALYATGNCVQILGTCAAYFTANTSPSAYDIEIGISGTATLYHELIGVYTSQSTGGVKLIDTGSHTLIGGQIGKLWIAAGTSPAGVNGGMTSNMRILGNVLVELSNSIFTGNQFNIQTITFAAGTSGHSLDWSNSTSTATIVNNGNANSTIVRATGSGGTYDVAYGASGPSQKISTTTGDVEFPGEIQLNNNKAIRVKDTTGSLRLGLNLSSGDDWFVGSDSGTGNFTIVSSGSQGVYLGPGGTAAFIAESGAFRPTTDGTANLGASGNRFNTVYATTGTINTSDEREKSDIRDLTAAEARVAKKLRPLLKVYKWRSDIDENGDSAKMNFGVIAQDVIKAFKSEKLNALDYGIVVHDEWDEKEGIVRDGVTIEPHRKAGERYGVRYDQLFAFILAAT